MNISYHSWKAYVECPKKFSKQYVEKAAPTEPLNEYFTLYGRLVEKFFELYCNIWRFKTPKLSPAVIRQKLVFIYSGIIKSSTVNWDLPYCRDSKEDIFEQGFQDICTIMDSPNMSYFLNTKSEISIGLLLKDGHKMKGRLDFIHTDQVGEDETVFDGKGTNKIGKNISNDQLFFYAFLYYFRFKKLPVQLGFFYYRFNSFIEIPIDMNVLNEFRARLSLDAKEMFKSDFPPTPCAKSCKYCRWFTGCTEGEQSRISRKRTSKIDLESNGKIVELGF